MEVLGWDLKEWEMLERRRWSTQKLLFQQTNPKIVLYLRTRVFPSPLGLTVDSAFIGPNLLKMPICLSPRVSRKKGKTSQLRI